MNLSLSLAAAVCLVAGALAVYLSMPHQALVSSTAPRSVRFAGAAALVIALGLLLVVMGSATAVFTWATALILLWSVPPVIIGWLRHRKPGQ